MRKIFFSILAVLFAWILVISSAEASSRLFVLADKANNHNYPEKAELSMNDSLSVMSTDGIILQTNHGIPQSSLSMPHRVSAPGVIKPPDSVVVASFESEQTTESRWEREPRREFLSLKTNLLFDVAYVPGYGRWCPIPNIAVEYYPRHGHFTYGASIDFPWWRDYDAHKFFEVRNYQLETRYYLRANGANETNGTDRANRASGLGHRGPAFAGFYLQAYVHAGLFQIAFDANRGWIGEGIGAGVGVGYVTPISRNGHWRLEFSLQAGWFGCKHDPFQYENPINPDYRDGLYYYKWTLSSDLFKERQYRFNWFGPTRVGITLSYDLLYRRIAKKGVSFRGYEPNRAYEANRANGAVGANGAGTERRVTP